MKRSWIIVMLLLVFSISGCFYGTDDSTSVSDDDVSDDDIADDDTDDDDTAPELESITVEPAYAGVPVGTTQQFRALGHFSDDSTQYLSDVSWSTSDDSLATIDESGVLSAAADGIVTVTAEKDGVSGQAKAYLKPDVLVIDSFGAGIAAADRASGEVTEFVLGGGTGTTPNKIYVHDGTVFVVDSNAGGEAGFLRYISLDDLYSAKDSAAESIELTGCKNPWDLAFVGDYIYITCTRSNSVVKVDLGSKGVVASIELPEGSAPQDIVYGADRLFLTATYYDYENYQANLGSFIEIDPASDTVVNEVFTGDYNPTGIVFNNAGNKLYISNTDWHDLTGTITVVTLGEEELGSIELGMAPGPLAMAQNGYLFVGEQAAGSVYVIDTSDDSVVVGADDPIAIPDAWWVHGLKYIADADAVYALDFNGYIYPIDPDSFELGDAFAFELTAPQDVVAY